MIKEINNILICKLKFYGDVLLITPVIESLKARYPNSKIDLLVYKETISILEDDPAINKFYFVERKASLNETIKNSINLRKNLKKNNYDVIINLTEQPLIAFLIATLRRPTVAFKHTNRLWDILPTRAVPCLGTHIVEQNLSILHGLDFPENYINKQLRLFYKHEDYEYINQKSSHIKNNNYIVIQPTSRQQFKCWDDDKFAKVVDYLHTKNIKVYMTCGPGKKEKEQVEHIASLCLTPPDLTFSGILSLTQLAALIDHSILYIGVDSAPMHMAAALHVPQVCLFGATYPQRWRPWSDLATVLWANDYHKMPERKNLDRNEKYLKWIPVENVLAAIDKKLNEKT